MFHIILLLTIKKLKLTFSSIKGITRKGPDNNQQHVRSTQLTDMGQQWLSSDTVLRICEEFRGVVLDDTDCVTGSTTHRPLWVDVGNLVPFESGCSERRGDHPGQLLLLYSN